jgi:RimJ/RimL family protein N-acetyltransferase
LHRINEICSLSSGLNSLEETEEWIKNTTSNSKSLIYSISLSSSTQIIGVIGLNLHSRLLYYLHPTVWGHGYASEAALTFRDLLFEKQPERSILVAGVHEGNHASLKVLTACGFVLTKDWRSEHPVGRRLSSVESTGLKSAIRDLGLQSKSPIADEVAAEQTDFTWYKYEKPKEILEE